MNFKLKTPKSQSSSLILSYVTLKDGKRFVYSTGQKIPVRLWDKSYQVPIKTKSQKDQVIINSVNLRLDRIKAEYLRLDLQYQKQGKQLTKEQFRKSLIFFLKENKKKRLKMTLKAALLTSVNLKTKREVGVDLLNKDTRCYLGF